MSKEITLTAHIHIVPLNDGEVPEGYTEGDQGTSHEHKRFDPHAKSIVLSDPDSGEVTHFKMSGQMVRRITEHLSLPNGELAKVLLEEVRAAQAKAMLNPNGSAGGQVKMTPEQIQELRGNG